MQAFMNLKLRWKLLILFIFIALIPVSILGLFSYQKSSNMMQEQMSEGVLEKLGQMNKNLSFFIRDVEYLSMYIYRNETVQEILSKPRDRDHVQRYEDYKKMNELFAILLGSKKWDIKIYIIGLNGDRYFTGDYLPPRYDQYMENWGIFRKAMIGNGTLVWDTHYSIRKIDPQEVVLSAGRVLKNIETNESLGYLVIDILEPALEDITSVTNELGEQLFLLDSQGYIISSYPNKTTIGTKLPYDQLGKLLNGSDGYLETNWEGSPHILVYDTAEDTQLKVASFLPIRQITDRNGLIRQITIAIGLLGLIVSIWLAYMISTSITKPLSRLIGLMKEVEVGKLDVQFDPRYTDDIGVLGRSFNQMVHRLKTLIREGYERQVRLKESELKALQAQINPHFLYNTLETVNWMAKIKRAPEISKVVVSLSQMLRYAIRKGDDLVLLGEELKQLEHYLTIQQIRYQDKFQVYMDVAEDAKQCMIPSFLLQPLVENAITHGLEMKLEKGSLWIQISVEDDHVHLKIEDDGVGMDPEVLERLRNHQYDQIEARNTGIGIENVWKRMQIYYGDMIEFQIDSQKDAGTKIYVKLPVVRGGGA